MTKILDESLAVAGQVESQGRKVLSRMWKRISLFLATILTVRDILFVLVGFVLASYMALQVFEWYMGNAEKLGGLVFREKPYIFQLKP